MDKDKFKLPIERHERIYKRIHQYLFQGKRPVDNGNPVAIILGGQPGSGKSRILEVARDDVPNGNVVIINGDEFRYWHPQYLEILHQHEQAFAELTDPDARVWTRRLFEYAIQHKYNIAFEGTMRTDAICNTMNNMMQQGYTVVTRVLAVPNYLSVLGTLRRYEAMKRERGYGRWVKPEDHDAAYVGMLNTVSRIEQEGIADWMEVYARPNRLIYQNQPSTIGSLDSFASAANAITLERNRKPTDAELTACIDGWKEVISMMLERNAPDAEIEAVKALAIRLMPD